MISKAELRREIAQKRRSLDPEWTAAMSLRIAELIQSQEVFRSARNISLYKAIAGEVDLECLFPISWKLGKCTCSPVFNSGERIYELADITALTQYRTGHYGIQEPEEVSLVALDQIDLMIVPGVAFDPFGRRLGRGGGYYDRLLSSFSGVAMAVAFDFQLVPHVPTDPHDLPVDYVITETKVLKVQNEH